MNTWPKKDRIFQRLYRFWSMSTSKLSKLKTTEAYKYQRLLLLLTRRRPQRRDHKQKCKSQEIKGDTLWRCWNHSTQPHLLWITEWHQQWHSSSLVIFLLSSPGYILAISNQKHTAFSPVFDVLLSVFHTSIPALLPLLKSPWQQIKDWMKMTMFCCSVPHTEELIRPSVLCDFDLCTVVFMVTSKEALAHQVQVFYPILIARKQLWQDWEPRLTNNCTLTKSPVKE